MADLPATDPNGPNPMGCFGALAIGVVVVAGNAGLFSLLTGRSLDLQDEAWPLVLQMLIVAAPFALLAFAAVRRPAPWLTGLALTLALWGYDLFEGVSYQWHPDGTGADIGLGLIMLVSPLPITAASVGVHLWQQRGGRAKD